MRKKSLGRLGEELAVKQLKNNGYRILEQNFRSKFGEIDIIAQDADDLVFIEVKTRWSKSFGPPEEAITPWKIKRMTQACQYYKLLHPQSPESLRLDAVCIDLSPAGKVGEIRLLKNISG